MYPRFLCISSYLFSAQIDRNSQGVFLEKKFVKVFPCIYIHTFFFVQGSLCILLCTSGMITDVASTYDMFSLSNNLFAVGNQRVGRLLGLVTRTTLTTG